MSDNRKPTDRRDTSDDPLPPSTPYGPHYAGVDESAGGADSSPFENVPPEEQRRAAQDEKSKGRDAGSGPPDPGR